MNKKKATVVYLLVFTLILSACAPGQERGMNEGQANQDQQNEAIQDRGNIDQDGTFGAAALTTRQQRIVRAARKYLGVPYKLGAEYNLDGSYKFDCSSYTQRVFYDALRIKLPRTVLTQRRATTKIATKNLRVGDLVYFDTDFSGGTNHIGIYLGNGRFIHASTAYGGKVQITDAKRSRFWRRAYTGATRVTK